jgi:hypothetical protein
MTNTIYLFTISLLFSACGQTNPKPNNKEATKETNTTLDTAGTGLTAEELIQLDTLDLSNVDGINAEDEYVTKAFVMLRSGDSTINLMSNIQKDHRIFGYAKPDLKSEKLLLLSVYTNDVEHNPYGCKLGAYYDTGGMGDLILKYIKVTGKFVQAIATDKANHSTTLYFEKKWIEFD